MKRFFFAISVLFFCFISCTRLVQEPSEKVVEQNLTGTLSSLETKALLVTLTKGDKIEVNINITGDELRFYLLDELSYITLFTKGELTKLPSFSIKNSDITGNYGFDFIAERDDKYYIAFAQLNNNSSYSVKILLAKPSTITHTEIDYTKTILISAILGAILGLFGYYITKNKKQKTGVETKNTSSLEQSTAPAVFCKSCGTKNEVDAKFCASCGKQL